MSVHLDDLERLARLREQGALSAEEFNLQKDALLNKPAVKRPSKLRTVLAVVAALGALAVALPALLPGSDESKAVSSTSASRQSADMASTIQHDSADTPGCDDSDVKQKVVEIVNKNIVESLSQTYAMAGQPVPRAHSANNPQQLHVDSESGFRACIAEVRHDKGLDKMGYTIEWRDRAQGMYWIQMVKAKALQEKYAGPASTHAGK